MDGILAPFVARGERAPSMQEVIEEMKTVEQDARWGDAPEDLPPVEARAADTPGMDPLFGYGALAIVGFVVTYAIFGAIGGAQ